MKIGITGHTRGLGKAIFDHFAGAHEIIGMSRQTGFDITTDLDKVIDAALSCDIFFNNAHVGQQQGTLISALHDKIPVVTSGSMAAEWPMTNSYCFQKFQIERVFKRVVINTKHPMLLLKMGYLENFPEKRFIPYSDILKAIDFWFECPRIHIIRFDRGEYFEDDK